MTDFRFHLLGQLGAGRMITLVVCPYVRDDLEQSTTFFESFFWFFHAHVSLFVTAILFSDTRKTITPMHPLVRDLYKRALVVGRDYPLGMDYVRRTWKKALRNPDNCPSCYSLKENTVSFETRECEKEMRKAVARGRFMVREMIGVIQLKKYRTLKRRYDNTDPSLNSDYVHLLIQNLENQSKGR